MSENSVVGEVGDRKNSWVGGKKANRWEKNCSFGVCLGKMGKKMFCVYHRP